MSAIRKRTRTASVRPWLAAIALLAAVALPRDAAALKNQSEFWSTGDCSLIPPIVDDAKQNVGDICRANAGHGPITDKYCSDMRDWARDLEKSMWAYCREHSAQKAQPRPPSTPSIQSTPAAPPQDSGQSLSVSCSDITGTSTGGPAATNCNTGNTAVATARKLRKQNPAAAQAKYREAADAYRRAGDMALARAILAELNALIASTAPGPQPRDDSANEGPPPPVTSPNPTPSVPPGPQTAQPSGPTAPGTQWMDTDDPADCANANSFQRTTAAWGSVCGPHIVAVCDIVKQSGYDVQDQNDQHVGRGAYWVDLCSADVADPPQPHRTDNVACPLETAAGETDRNCHPKTSAITFGALNSAGAAACPGMVLDQRRACIENAKLAYLLANDPDVRVQCGAIADHKRQLYCADVVYLYGPNSPAKDDLRAALRASMTAAADNLPDWVKGLAPLPPSNGRYDDAPVDHRCPPGEGVQPIPGTAGGFVRWDCAPLASAQPGQVDAGPGETPDSAEQSDQAAADVATLITSATAPHAGANLSEKDRATCTAVAYRAVLAQMKGGRTGVPTICAPVVAAARAEFASFASHEIGTGSRMLDALLPVLEAYYANAGFGGDLGPPPPGMQGLAPTDADRRQADCIVAGGSLDECAREAATSRATEKQP